MCRCFGSNLKTRYYVGFTAGWKLFVRMKQHSDERRLHTRHFFSGVKFFKYVVVDVTDDYKKALELEQYYKHIPVKKKLTLFDCFDSMQGNATFVG